MKVFVFEYDGQYLGGKAVVIASSLPQAKKVLREKLLPKDYSSLKEISRENVGGETILVYTDDGEY